MAQMELVDTCWVARGDSKTVTFADDWYALNKNQGNPEFVTNVFHGGELKSFKQYFATSLVLILRRNDLLKKGKEIEIRRTDDDRGDYEVIWFENGDMKSDEEAVMEGRLPLGALGP